MCFDVRSHPRPGKISFFFFFSRGQSRVIRNAPGEYILFHVDRFFSGDILKFSRSRKHNGFPKTFSTYTVIEAKEGVEETKRDLRSRLVKFEEI